MGKSPGKWIRTVFFGKKSSKSNLSKDATLDKKTFITINSQSKDLDSNSTVIPSPVRHVINVNSTMGLNAANDDELIRLQQAATKAQAAFRGYLARRAFWALKGIIRLQALVRGHLVRRQAVATLSCMRAIIEFQALVRGQRVRLSGNGRQILHKITPREPSNKKRADLLQTSLKSEKLSINAFGAKLVASSNTTMPLNIQYDPAEPNSVRNWLERWSGTHFWDPLPKTLLDVKPKRKQAKLQSIKAETARPKRSFRNIPAPNLNNNNNNSNNVESNGKENQKTRRKSFPVKQEYSVPSYMAATESAKAKLRAQAAVKAAEDEGEDGFVRRHSLPSVTGKGGSKINKPQVSARDEKAVSGGWRK